VDEGAAEGEAGGSEEAPVSYSILYSKKKKIPRLRIHLNRRKALLRRSPS